MITDEFPIETLYACDCVVADSLIVNVNDFEGPLDLLLTKSHSQIVGLRQISISDLVEQYLTFVSKAGVIRLELNAAYLLRAAWLALLRSRLLLQADPYVLLDHFGLEDVTNLPKLKELRSTGLINN